jgi:hypothetical protein
MTTQQHIVTEVLIVLASSCGFAGQGPSVCSLKTGETPVLTVPLHIDLEGLGYPGDPCVPVLYRISGSTRIPLPCQIEAGHTARLWFIPDKTWEPNTDVNLELGFEGRARPSDQTTASVDANAITLRWRGKDILSYHSAIHPVPTGVDPLYRRSGFLHPLWSPAGRVLTRIQPTDHYHHYGIWNPWTVTQVEGKEVDFWNLAKGQGTVRFAGVLSTMSGSVYGGFKVRQEHVVLGSQANKEKTAINEVWDVRAFPSQVDGRPVWVIDFTTFLSSALDSVIELPSYRYGGGIGFRATDDWTRENCSVLTSEGKTRDQADGTRARWCDVRGGTGPGRKSGILFLSHPANREHPEPMRVWPSDIDKEKGRVFFEFCPIRIKGWSFEPGTENVLRYRMIVYDGTLDPKIMETLWKNYAYPPVVTVKQ